MTLHVRMPKPAVQALKKLARQCNSTISKVVRAGVAAKLATMVPPLVKTTRDDTASDWQKLQAIKTLRLLAMTALYLGPRGLEMARGRELAKAMEREMMGKSK